MTDKQIIGGRGAVKSRTTLNTIEVMLENEKLKSELKAKEQECEKWKKYGSFYLDKFILLKQTLTEIKEIAESDTHYFSNGTFLRYEVVDKILQKINEAKNEKI